MMAAGDASGLQDGGGHAPVRFVARNRDSARMETRASVPPLGDNDRMNGPTPPPPAGERR
jgi:hypothetical protein